MKLRLLLDANISWRSVSVLKDHFDDCFHVDNTELVVPAKDIQIWDYALKNEMIIVSNDEDFLNFLLLKGFPPKVILLRTGNQSRERTEQLLITSKTAIAEFLLSTEQGLLEIVG